MPVFVGSCIACEIFMDVMPNCCPANASPPPKWTENASSQSGIKTFLKPCFKTPKNFLKNNNGFQYILPHSPPTYSRLRLSSKFFKLFFCNPVTHTTEGKNDVSLLPAAHPCHPLVLPALSILWNPSPWAAEKSIGSLRRLLAIPLRLWQQIAHHDAGARVMCILLHCSARIFSLFGSRLASVLRIFAARVQ